MIVDDITDVNHQYQSLMSQGDKHETPLSLSLTLSIYIQGGPKNWTIQYTSLPLDKN